MVLVGCGAEVSGGSGAGSNALSTRSASFQNGAAPEAGYAGVTDTTLQEAAAATVDGSNVNLRVDHDYPNGSGKSSNVLLRFDVSTLPAESTVESATLTLNVTNRSTAAVNLYPVSRPWNEAQATWSSAGSGSAWSAGGGRGGADRSSSLAGTVSASAPGKVTLALNAGVVEAWVRSAASNHGLSLDSANNADGLQFDSSEATTVGNRPKLTVVYALPVGAGTGLRGDYFSGISFNALVASRTDATVSFDWGTGSPAAGLPSDRFSVRWSGQLVPLYTQTYTFYSLSDDGVRVWVNGVKLIDNWNDHAPTENSGTLALTAGQKYDVRVDFYENGGGAVSKLSWSSTSQPKQIIPTSQLFPATTPPPLPPPPGGFVHPGLHLDQGELDFVKAKVAAGAEPWTSQFNKARNSSLNTRAWVDQTVATMQCGNAGSVVDLGCTVARDDGLKAYTYALLFAYSGDKTYAAKAITILNAWSAKLKTIVYDGTDNNTYQAPLQAAWMAEMWPRSAEILRYSDSGWSASDAARFGTMLQAVLLPHIVKGWYGHSGNWNTSMANGVLNIGVYKSDRATFQTGLALWAQALRNTFYLKADGPYPFGSTDYTNADGTWKPGKLASGWWGANEFGQERDSGITSEVCRDLGHTQMQLASVAQGAETARIQGTDLFGPNQERIIATYEFVARYVNLYAPPNNAAKVVAVESWVCNGSMDVDQLPTWEIAYNHYVTGEGVSMPRTTALIPTVRKYGSYTNLQMAWETLTHAGTGIR